MLCALLIVQIENIIHKMNPYVIYVCFDIVTGLFISIWVYIPIRRICILFLELLYDFMYYFRFSVSLRSQKTMALCMFYKNLDTMWHAWYSLKKEQHLTSGCQSGCFSSSKFIWILKLWEVVTMLQFRTNYNVFNEYQCCHFTKFISIEQLRNWFNRKVEIRVFGYPM